MRHGIVAMFVVLALLTASAGCVTIKPPTPEQTAYLAGKDALYWGVYRASKGKITQADLARAKPFVAELRAAVAAEGPELSARIEEVLVSEVPRLVDPQDAAYVEQMMRDLAKQIVAKDMSEGDRKTRDVVLRVLDGILDGIDYACGVSAGGSPA